MRTLVLPLGIGLAVFDWSPARDLVLVLMPACCPATESRGNSYCAAGIYSTGALWPLVPGAKNFFGADASLPAGVALWGNPATTLLASPWPLIWSRDTRQALWRAPAGLMLTVVHPSASSGGPHPSPRSRLPFPGDGVVRPHCMCAPDRRNRGLAGEVRVERRRGFNRRELTQSSHTETVVRLDRGRYAFRGDCSSHTGPTGRVQRC